ncbi:P glycoprotein 16 [Aphelenchoides avenae]|nr:P glycoprotein 16 [Aphelenchus avenae]
MKRRVSWKDGRSGEEEDDVRVDPSKATKSKPRASLIDILRFSRPERTHIIVGVLFAVIRGMAWPVWSVIYGRMFLALSQTTVENAKDMTAEYVLSSIAFLVLGIVSGTTGFGSGALLGIVGERMTMRLRMEVFKNILRQDASFFDDPRHSTGKLTARLASDATNVQAAIDQRLAEVLQGVVSLFCGIGVAFYFGWNMAPIGLVTAISFVIVQISISRYLKRRGVKDAEIVDEASKIAAEAVENVRTVQALNKQKHMHELFCAASHKPHKRAMVRGLWQAFSYALSTGFVAFNFTITYLVGMLLVRGGYTTPFTVFQVIEALNLTSLTVMTAAAFFPEYLRARIAAGIMFSMKDHKPKIDSLSEQGIVKPIEGTVDFNQVNFAYPNSLKSMVLNDFELAALSGRTIALVGPSGCGKSTTMQLLERFYDVMSGSIQIDGVDIRHYNIRHLRASMALVGQEPTLFDVSIRDNIAYGMESVSQEEIVEAANKYDTMVGDRGTQLSGGQKQRIAIARAIVRNPKILLLDEATSALDSESEQVVQQALERARAGRTCLVIAHRLSTVQHADLIAVVRNGRVEEVGNHHQLLARKGLYYRLVLKQSS